MDRETTMPRQRCMADRKDEPPGRGEASRYGHITGMGT
jgi:hypothetical protein